MNFIDKIKKCKLFLIANKKKAPVTKGWTKKENLIDYKQAHLESAGFGGDKFIGIGAGYCLEEELGEDFKELYLCFIDIDIKGKATEDNKNGRVVFDGSDDDIIDIFDGFCIQKNIGFTKDDVLLFKRTPSGGLHAYVMCEKSLKKQTGISAPIYKTDKFPDYTFHFDFIGNGAQVIYEGFDKSANKYRIIEYPHKHLTEVRKLLEKDYKSTWGSKDKTKEGDDDAPAVTKIEGLPSSYYYKDFTIEEGGRDNFMFCLATALHNLKGAFKDPFSVYKKLLKDDGIIDITSDDAPDLKAKWRAGNKHYSIGKVFKRTGAVALARHFFNRFAYIESVQEIINLETKEIFPSPKDFKTYLATLKCGWGGIVPSTPFDYIIEHYNILRAKEKQLLPQDKSGLVENSRGCDDGTTEGYFVYNSYVKSEYIKKAKANKNLCKDLQGYLNHLFAGDKDMQADFLKVMAFIIRNPGVKLPYAVVLASPVQGVGKSTMALLLQKCIGTAHATTVSNEAFKASDNTFLSNKLLVCVEEIIINNYNVSRSKMKHLLTSEKLDIKSLHKNVYKEQNLVNFLFTLNDLRDLNIKESDRRYYVFETKAQDASADASATKYVAKIINEINSGVHSEIIQNFIDYLYSLDISTVSMGTPPKTTSFALAVEKALSPEAEVIERLIDGSLESDCREYGIFDGLFIYTKNIRSKFHTLLETEYPLFSRNRKKNTIVTDIMEQKGYSRYFYNQGSRFSFSKEDMGKYGIEIKDVRFTAYITKELKESNTDEGIRQKIRDAIIEIHKEKDNDLQA